MSEMGSTPNYNQVNRLLNTAIHQIQSVDQEVTEHPDELASDKFQALNETLKELIPHLESGTVDYTKLSDLPIKQAKLPEALNNSINKILKHLAILPQRSDVQIQVGSVQVKLFQETMKRLRRLEYTLKKLAETRGKMAAKTENSNT